MCVCVCVRVCERVLVREGKWPGIDERAEVHALQWPDLPVITVPYIPQDAADTQG